MYDYSYDLDREDRIDEGKATYHGTWTTEVDMHIQEFAENSVDYMHFDPLHGKMTLPWTDIPIPGITIDHKAGWELDEGRVCGLAGRCPDSFDVHHRLSLIYSCLMIPMNL